MGQRAWGEGASERRPVMGRIEGKSPTDDLPSRRKPADFPQVFHHERTWPTNLTERRRHVGGSNTCWCGSGCSARLAFHELEESRAERASAPGAYREGCTRG